jgi:hypothetical protein
MAKLSSTFTCVFRSSAERISLSPTLCTCITTWSRRNTCTLATDWKSGVRVKVKMVAAEKIRVKTRTIYHARSRRMSR